MGTFRRAWRRVPLAHEASAKKEGKLSKRQKAGQEEREVF